MINKAFIIAEIGINHNGNINLAKKMIRLAKEFGADAVKFQSFITKNLVTKTEKQMPYQLKNNKSKVSQFEMLKKSELNFDQQTKLKKYCKQRKIEFISTPYDESSAKFLKKIGVNKIKIASTDITNVPFLRKIGHKSKPVVLSTGASNIDEIEQALSILKHTNTGMSVV